MELEGTDNDACFTLFVHIFHGLANQVRIILNVFLSSFNFPQLSSVILKLHIWQTCTQLPWTLQLDNPKGNSCLPWSLCFCFSVVITTLKVPWRCGIAHHRDRCRDADAAAQTPCAPRWGQINSPKSVHLTIFWARA